MSSKAKYLRLTGILLLAVFLRFYHLTSTPPGLFQDEAMDGNNAVEVAETGHFQTFYQEDSGREGLYVNIIALFLKEWPIAEPWVIRLPAMVAGVLTVLGVYFLAAEFFGGEIGLLAAFLLATSVWHITLSRVGFRAILSPLLLTWTCYFLTKAFKATSFKSSWAYSILAGVVYALGFYSYIAYRITPVLVLLFILPFRKYAGCWKKALLFIAVTSIVAAPIALYFLTHPGDFSSRMSEIALTGSKTPVYDLARNLALTALMLNIHGDYNWRHNISGAPELFRPVGILFIIGLAVGIYAIWRGWHQGKLSRSPLPAIFGWIVLAALPAVASDEGLPHALRSILLLPPVMVVSALGGVWLYRLMKKQWGAVVADTIAVAFLAAAATFGYYDYFIVWARNPNVIATFNADYVEIGREINALPRNAPKYVVVTASGGLTHGIPIPAETVMFITDSFTTRDREARNIHYLLPEQISTIPPNTPCSEVFYVTSHPSVYAIPVPLPPSARPNPCSDGRLTR